SVCDEDRILLPVEPAARVENARVEDDAVARTRWDPLRVPSEKVHAAQSRQHVGGRAGPPRDPALPVRRQPGGAMAAGNESELETAFLRLQIDAHADNLVRLPGFVPVGAVAKVARDAVAVPRKR